MHHNFHLSMEFLVAQYYGPSWFASFNSMCTDYFTQETFEQNTEMETAEKVWRP